MLLATWQGKFSILFFIPLRILSGTLNPATVVCGVDAVSARVAPVPHLVRYDWAFFLHRCRPGFRMISISSSMMRVLSCMCCARRLYRALTFCWLLHAGTHGCHARVTPLRARRCGATDGRATRNVEGELSAAGARCRPSLCASRHVTSKEEPRRARGVSCLRMRPNYDAERHVGGVAHL